MSIDKLFSLNPLTKSYKMLYCLMWRLEMVEKLKVLKIKRAGREVSVSKSTLISTDLFCLSFKKVEVNMFKTDATRETEYNSYYETFLQPKIRTLTTKEELRDYINKRMPGFSFGDIRDLAREFNQNEEVEVEL